MLSIEVYKKRLTQLKNKFGRFGYPFEYPGICWHGKIPYGLTPWEYYNYYMKSRNWFYVKTDRLIRDNYKCQSCGSELNLNVHHKTYCNFSFESYDDLITLCQKCHLKAHIKEYFLFKYHPEELTF